MSRHVIGYDELNGHVVETMIGASSKEEKRLSVLTTVGETPSVIYRVYNFAERVQHDYDSYGDSLLAYNSI